MSTAAERGRADLGTGGGPRLAATGWAIVLGIAVVGGVATALIRVALDIDDGSVLGWVLSPLVLGAVVGGVGVPAAFRWGRQPPS